MWDADAFGRRKTLLWTGVLVVLAGAASGLAPDIYTFAALRFLTGTFHQKYFQSCKMMEGRIYSVSQVSVAALYTEKMACCTEQMRPSIILRF